MGSGLLHIIALSAFICVICDIVCVSSVDPNVVATIIAAWREVQHIYQSWSQKEQEPPTLILKFTDARGFARALPVSWDENIDPDRMNISPFEALKSGITQLVSKKRDGIDPSECQLFYDIKDAGMTQITNDHDVSRLVQLEGDLKVGDVDYRQVFVRCPGMDVSGGGSGDGKYNENQFTLVSDAYRHVVALQAPVNYDRVDLYNEELEDKMDLAGFEVEANALQIQGMTLSKYREQIEELGNAFGWSDKIQRVVLAAAEAVTTKEAIKEVKFDQKNWKLHGNTVRVATVLSEDKKSISLTVATTRFDVDVPEQEKEQNTIQWLTNKGTIKHGFKKKIEYLMQAEAQESATVNLKEPIIEQFLSDGKQEL